MRKIATIEELETECFRAQVQGYGISVVLRVKNLAVPTTLGLDEHGNFTAYNDDGSIMGQFRADEVCGVSGNYIYL